MKRPFFNTLGEKKKLFLSSSFVGADDEKSELLSVNEKMEKMRKIINKKKNKEIFRIR